MSVEAIQIERTQPEEILEPSVVLQERQARFESTLRTVKILSQQAGRELPIRSVETPYFIPQESGVYVLVPHLESSNAITDVNFNLDRQLLSGRADSAHSVVTGEIQVNHKKTGIQEVKVAAKCFAKRTPQERYERAVREASIMKDLSRQGELSTEPIAIAIANDDQKTKGEVVLLTKYKTDLQSMDNLPWTRGIRDKSNVSKAVQAARALGDFNARLGYQHNDAKIKNVAGDDSGRVGMIDFETTTILNTNDPEQSAIAALDDFGKLLDSLEKKGFIKRPQAIDNMGFANSDGSYDTRRTIDELGEAYLSAWSGHDATVQNAVSESVTWITAKYNAAYV